MPINKTVPVPLDLNMKAEHTKDMKSVPVISLTQAGIWQEIYGTSQKGYNESFNGKFRDELLNCEIFDTLFEAKVLIEEWRKEYNTFRPHSALGYLPPAPETVEAIQTVSATLQLSVLS